MNKKCRHFRKIYSLVRRNDCHDPINSFGNFVPASRSTAQPAARIRDTHNSTNIDRKFVTRTLKIGRNLGSRAALLSANTQRRHTDRQNNSFTGKRNSVFTDRRRSRVAIDVDRGHGRSFPGAAAIRQAGKLYALALEVLRCIPRRPFQLREFVQQFWFVASVSILPDRAGRDPVRRCDRAAARLADRADRRAVVHRRRERARRHPAGQPDRHRADDRRRRRVGDLRRPRRAHHPRGDRRDGGARHLPDPAPGRARACSPRCWSRCCSTAWSSSSAWSAATSSTWCCRAARPAPSSPASPRSPSCPTCWIGEVKALLFGFVAGVVAAYNGLNAGGGPKGVGDAVNQSVVITLHAAVPDQPRASPPSTCSRPAKGV